MDIARYKLADEAFWESDDRGSDPAACELVGEYRGLVVDAPQRVDTEKRATLPAGIYHLGRIRELAAVKFDRLGVITAVDTGRNRLYVTGGRSLQQDDDVIPGEPRDPATLPGGDMSTTYSSDLRALLGIPWRPGRLLVTALLRDVVSNRSAVELVGPPVAGTVERARAEDVFPPPDNTATFYRLRRESPGLPAGAGIELSPERIVDVREARRWPLYGSYRVRPAAREVTGLEWPAAVAVVGIHLLIVGTNDGDVSVVSLRAPSFEWSGELATGYFAVDLMQVCDLRSPQTYFVTAFCREVMGGPAPSAIVHPGF